MNPSLLLLIGSLFYIIMIAILYFKKQRISSIENKIYKYLLLVGIFGVIMDITGIYVHSNLPEESLIRWFVLRFYHSYLLTTIFLLSLYMLMLKYNEVTKENRRNIHLLIETYIVCLIINFITPVVHHKEGNIIYASGPNINFLYSVAGIAVLCWTVYIIKNFKKLKKKKYTPIIVFVVLSVPVILIQMQDPSLLLVTSLITFIIVFMYHTIENPDMKLIEQLNIARNQADRANNAKSEFLSNMSHEIRTPLNAIVGFSQALSEEENVPEEAKDEIKDIMMASQNLLEIVNGILDISKIEANKLEIVNTEYSLKNVLEELTSLTKIRIGEKPITLRTVFDPSIPPVLYGDYVRLKQIVLNLLTNAAKYTKEGYIEFKVDSVIKDDVCRLIISVEDTGIGIKKESIDKLFNKFERLDVEKNITIEGTGLGLAITKKLVELMNGNIVVQSEYGNGSKFTVAIDQRIVEGKEEIVSEVNTEIELFEAKDKKILLVDDNKVNLKVAVRLLQNYQMQIDQVVSGQECIDKIKEGNSYDLILLDDMMPKMSGIETLRELQKIEGFQIPTIAFTANAITGMKEKYLNEGFSDYLSKPIDKLELNHLLIKYLKEGEK